MNDMLNDITQQLVSRFRENESAPNPEPSVSPPSSTADSEGDSIFEHSRIGKIARLPADTREIVNLMLRDNVPYPAIIEKLASLGYPGVSPTNLTRWKQGGYLDWLCHRHQDETLRAASRSNLQLIKELTAEEQHAIHQILELTFANQMLSALAHLHLGPNLSKDDAEKLAKLGSAISRHFRERTRHQRVQLALHKQQLVSLPPADREKNETAI
jgi:hypothetical protein